MSRHTTFQVGGPADLFIEPNSPSELTGVLRTARETGLPVFILGGGANILVSDAGFRGLIVGMGRLSGVRCEDTRLITEPGLAVSAAAEFAAENSLGGLDFLYSMPGSVGGAVWMNARCYGSSVSDILEEVRYLDKDLVERRSRTADPAFASGFAYKKSPFQQGFSVILEASFRLHPEPPEEIRRRMRENVEDRRRKGHFTAPSAGSVFKNNRDFGAPSGEIIDRLGFRGFRIGDAQVSPQHANIIINAGQAKAADVRRIIDIIQKKVQSEFGYFLEPEVLFIGDWAEV